MLLSVDESFQMVLVTRHVGVSKKGNVVQACNLLRSGSLDGDFDLAFFAAFTCASSASNDSIFR